MGHLRLTINALTMAMMRSQQLVDLDFLYVTDIQTLDPT